MSSKAKKFHKLAILIESQDLLDEQLDLMEATLTDHSSDLDYVAFGRYQAASLQNDQKIRKLKIELGLIPGRPKVFKTKK